MNTITTDPRWYRVPFVWLLVMLPLASVVGAFALLWLSIESDDGLVVDDYYRQGREINRELTRDNAAAALALKGQLRFDAARREARIELNLPAARLPNRLEFALLHATRQGYDQRFVLTHNKNGAYRASLTRLVPGHYYIQLAADGWRLVGSVRVPQDADAEILPAGQR